MTFSWFGQACFRIEAKEGSILIDPFSKEIGLKPPKIKDDLVLVTHEHMDHNAVGDANPEAFIIRNPGEYEKQGIAVRGIASFHDNKEGAERGPNTIYIIRAEDMVLAHLGDLGQDKLSDEQVEAIGDIDILMIPVGGSYTIDAKKAVEVIGQIEPKIVIPMHYKIPGIEFPLDGVDKFVKELGLTPEKVDKYKIVKKNLPTEEMQLVTFNI
ncbi:MAG TPA: MBL fold metallo-hydrolase [Candidatus Paceibacterota bacterium]|nr:MBL fold metallo-hydrolase [Candidatus Paceibacterota bacterium]